MYSAREVATVLGVSPGRLRAYLRAGLVAPERDERGAMTFSFQDLALLRKAEGLVLQRVPPRRVQEALRRLRARLGDDVPLSGVQLTAEGAEIVVTDRGQRWNPTSGQVMLPFPDTDGAPAPVVELRRKPEPPPPDPAFEAQSAQELFEQGCALEAADRDAAIAVYRRALARQPDHADANVNLGRLLHEGGDPFAALAHYRAALEARPGDATAAFNLGVALEDLDRQPDAIEAYERCLALEPDNADAHYNLARLLEQAGRPEGAVKHLLAYRRLTRKR